MGGNSQLMLQREEELDRAAAYLVRIGRLERCEYHGEIYGGAFGVLEGDTYEQAMIDRKKGVNGPIPWAAGMPTREFTDSLKDAYGSFCGDECSSCANHEDE